MPTQRLFIAVELSAKIIQGLEAVMRTFQKNGLQAVHWVKAKNIHLTLRFLGDTTQDQLGLINTSLPVALAEFQPFDLVVEGCGAFPNARLPRVVWVGVKAPPELFQMQKIVEKICCQAGFTPDVRPFSPHLTLGRVPPEAAARVGQALNPDQRVLLGQTCVTRLTLFKSDLFPGGAVYCPLTYFPLK